MNAQELGAQLQAARLEKQLSVEQVSRVLSLRPSLVSALECGNYREIGALLYAKNYLRKYAAFLGISGQAFEAILEQLQDAHDPKSQGYYESSKVKLEKAEKTRSNHIKYYFIFVLVVIAALAYLYQSGVIPSPFKERLSIDSKENVSLPNERLPSLELEYNLRGHDTVNSEDLTFEERLIDSLKEQQDTMANEYHIAGTTSLAEDAFGGLDDDQHIVMLNKENEFIAQSDVPKNSTVRTKARVGSGNFQVLGTALRYYAPLLSPHSLPLIDLGTKTSSGYFVAPTEHINYLYDSANTVWLGVDTPAIVESELLKRARHYTSIYDRESGFYPYVSRIVNEFRLNGKLRQFAALEQEIKGKREQLLAMESEETLSAPNLNAFNAEFVKMSTHLETLTEEIAAAQKTLDKRVVVRIEAADITTLDIQDQKGRVITNRVMSSGDAYQLEGLGLYDVYLGNPAVIDKITVNGKAIPEYYYRPLTEEAVSIRFSLNSEQYH